MCICVNATPQQSLYWECSTCSTTSGLSLDGCDVRLVDRESFEGADANMVPDGDDETPWTNEEAQEATVRACCSANPGRIIGGIPRTASKSHLDFSMTLCSWQQERGALYNHDPSRFRGCTFRGTFSQNNATERRECLARTGPTTSGDWARLDSNLPAMSRARVWTNSFTVAEHVQHEAIDREGPSHSEELFHLLRVVIQGEGLSHSMQFAKRLCDTADEELVTPLENFVTAAHRDLDRADEAAEIEVDESNDNF